MFEALILWGFLTGKLCPQSLPHYSTDPVERLQVLMYEPENLRQILNELDRYWMVDQPSHPTPDGSQDKLTPNRRCLSFQFQQTVAPIQITNPMFIFTGGLLLPKPCALPGDGDFDVVQAVVLALGSSITGNQEQTDSFDDVALATVTVPSSITITVFRRLPDKGQFPIRVNLADAMRDPRQCLLIQEGDWVFLQETTAEPSHPTPNRTHGGLR